MLKPSTLLLCCAVLCVGTANAEPTIEKRPVTISPREPQVGDSIGIRYARTLEAGFKKKGGGTTRSFYAKVPDARFVVEVAEVDSASQVKRLLISGESKPTTWELRARFKTDAPLGQPFKAVFVRDGSTPKEAKRVRGLEAATALFGSGLHDLGGLKGTLKPGQRVKLSAAFWEGIDAGNASTERAVTYLGTNKEGLGVLDVAYAFARRGSPSQDLTTLWAFRGRIVFDPKGPAVCSVVLDADVELIVPEGRDLTNLGKGSLRYTFERPAKKE